MVLEIFRELILLCVRKVEMSRAICRRLIIESRLHFKLSFFLEQCAYSTRVINSNALLCV